MPTQHPRYTVTETESLAAALRSVRHLFPKQVKKSQVLTELIQLGAQAKLTQSVEQNLNEDRKRELRERSLERVRTMNGIDRDAFLEVRSSGWIKPR